MGTIPSPMVVSQIILQGVITVIGFKCFCDVESVTLYKDNRCPRRNSPCRIKKGVTLGSLVLQTTD